MDTISRLDLPLEDGRSFYLKKNRLESVTEELEEFLSLDNNMHDLHFAKKMMFSHELQANNQVEGYGDDVQLIETVIKKKTDRIKDEEKKKRILNLYRGYQYILQHKKIDKNHLRELYSILSNDLLSEADLTKMGDYYRLEPVYILFNGRLDTELEEGANHENVPHLMNSYFEFFNTPLSNSTKTDEYIKSQILHYYFVYIHPFFDVNGRTSRTMSMWHLLNSKAYPYIIFNRGISFRGTEYDRIIRDTKTNCDLTKFIMFMLDTVKIEMEKEYVMQSIAANTNEKLSGVDYQTLLYFLSINGLKTAKDFATYYNNLNDKKKVSDIYEEMIEPLIQYNVLNIDRYTKKNLNNETSNMVLSLNKNKIDINPEHIRRLKL